MFVRCLASLLVFGALSAMAVADDHKGVHQFQVTDIDGKKVDLESYDGKVMLIVNTASRCGLTPQYNGLESLHQRFKEEGLVVLGFPCNQFGLQEPGSDADIKQFCSTEYDVSFPMFSKIEVKGEGADPLYKFLTAKDLKPAGTGKISWNFEKFLIDREGNVVHRFEPRTKPEDAEVVKAIETELDKG